MEEWTRTITTYPATCCAVLSFVMAGVCGLFSVCVAPFVNDPGRSKKAMENGGQAAVAFLVVGILILFGIGITANKYKG